MTGPPDPGVGPFADLLGIRRAAMADGRARFELSAGALEARAQVADERLVARATGSFYILAAR